MNFDFEWPGDDDADEYDPAEPAQTGYDSARDEKDNA